MHAGDLTNAGTPRELSRALDWLERASSGFAARIVVAGNHDLSLDGSFCDSFGDKRGIKGHEEEGRDVRGRIKGGMGDNWYYLEHEHRVLDVDGVCLRVFGSPFSRRIGPVGTWAFSYSDGDEAYGLWALLPRDLDLLVVHGPPLGICDVNEAGKEDGCEALLQLLGTARPRLLVCGHRHEGRGCAVVEWSNTGHVEKVYRWIDETAGSKKVSLIDLTGVNMGRWTLVRHIDEASGSDKKQLEIDNSFSLVSLLRDPTKRWTCVVNAAIMAHSYGYDGPRETNKAVVVDLPFAAKEPS